MDSQKENWTIDFSKIKNLEFTDINQCKLTLQSWALEEGFELSKQTGTKPYAIYFECSRGGKPRKFANAEGKRSKSSKKIGNRLI